MIKKGPVHSFCGEEYDCKKYFIENGISEEFFI
jgi:hypothetical protein